MTVTDGNGCVSGAAEGGTNTVTVINRCGNNIQKSLLCHVSSNKNKNPRTICISPNALQAHLASEGGTHTGDYCGSCSGTSKSIIEQNSDESGAIFARAYPNPFTGITTIEFSVQETGIVTVEIYNLAGKLVNKLFNGEIEAMTINAVEFEADHSLTTGLYIYKVKTPTAIRIDKLTLIR